MDQGGLLLSQFEPGARPYPANFLNRNRIIAGLSLGVLVVSAGLRSGSLVTARYALEEGREVLVVPGAITDFRFEGSNRLLRQGAALITCLSDVYDSLPALAGSAPETPEAKIEITPAQGRILSMLQKHHSLSMEALAQMLQDRAMVASQILELELKDLIVTMPGGMVALTARAATIPVHESDKA
jgi:DNA processing protein